MIDNGGVEISANLKDAMAQRLRRGLRIAAAVTGPVLFVTASVDLLLRETPSMGVNLARAAIAVLVTSLAFTLKAGATHARINGTVIAAHVLLVGYALLRVAITGGAASHELATLPLAITALTVLLPVEPRMAWPLYGFFYIVSAAIGHLQAPPHTPTGLYLNLHSVLIVSCILSAIGTWLQHRTLSEMFEWRFALREESRRTALALERARIARDLHDHVGARMTGIALRAEREQKKLPPEGRDALIWIQDTIRLCLEELRDTIWALSNSGRDARELVATLRRRAEDIADAADLQLTWTMREESWNDRLSPGVSVALSAILREALTNTIRHSGAKHVAVTLMRESDRISLEVADDGKGLGTQPSEGRGLNNMRSRAKEQDGDVRIEANGEQGLRVIATIPLLSERVEPA